jgi:hypothetical protein
MIYLVPETRALHGTTGSPLFCPVPVKHRNIPLFLYKKNAYFCIVDSSNFDLFDSVHDFA